MKCVFAILIFIFFFLPLAKGQGEELRVVEDSNSNVNHYDGPIRFGHKTEGTFYIVNGIVVDTTKPAEIIPQTWLNTNKLLNKTYTEKDFQYTNFDYFISTRLRLQR